MRCNVAVVVAVVVLKSEKTMILSFVGHAPRDSLFFFLSLSLFSKALRFFERRYDIMKRENWTRAEIHFRYPKRDVFLLLFFFQFIFNTLNTFFFHRIALSLSLSLSLSRSLSLSL